LVSLLQRILRHFFSPSGPHQVLRSNEIFLLICKFADRSKGTLRAILPGRFAIANRRLTVRDDSIFPISLAIVLEDLSGIGSESKMWMFLSGQDLNPIKNLWGELKREVGKTLSK